MTVMTTDAKQPVETAKETPNLPATGSVKTVPLTQSGSSPVSEKPAERKTSGAQVKTEPVVTKSASAPVKTPEPVKTASKTPAERLTFHKEKFAEYKLVRMYLLQGGCIQYDPAFPELVLNTSDKRGMILPLTPFFKSRIGVMLELVL